MIDCVDGEPGPDLSNVTWHGYLGMTIEALSQDPLLHSGPTSQDALIIGRCGVARCQHMLDFIDVTIGPNGQPWAAYVDGCLEPCSEPLPGTIGEAVVGRFWDGPNLWSEPDPNGPDGGLS